MGKPKKPNRKLQHERELRGWSQARLAEKLGTTVKRVSLWECGDSVPDRYYQEKLCDLFGKNAFELGLIKQPDATEAAIQHTGLGLKPATSQFHGRIIPLPPQPYFAHPYPLQENFTGRVQEQRWLTAWLTEDTRPILALTALGGMGKSSLVWAWLQQNILNLPEVTRPEGVLWWSFYDTEATFTLFIDQALIYVGGGNIDPSTMTSMYQKCQVLISLLQQRRILLIMDGFERALRAYAGFTRTFQEDIDQEEIQSSFRACIDPHLGSFIRWVAAGSLSSKLLLTTRLFPHELDNLAGCRRVELAAMKTEDAIAFIHVQGVRGTRAETEALCKIYGNHPLTLRLLTGLIVNDPGSPGDAHIAREYNPVPDLVQRNHHILTLAYDALQQPLQQLLSRLAAFRSKVNFEMAKVASPFELEKKLKEGLKELVERGLLFFNREQRYYDLHPIVRQYAYARLLRSKDIHACLAEYFWSKIGKGLTAEVMEPLRKIRAFTVEPSSNNHSFEESLDNLAPIIDLCYHLIQAKQLEKAFGIYYNHLASQLYHRLGTYQIVIELLQAFSLDEDSLRQLERRKQSWVLDALAHAFSASDYPQRAVDLLEASIAIDRELGEKENLATALWNLAVQQQVLGKLAASERSLHDCIAVCSEVHDAFNSAKAHQYIALQCAYQGTFEEALHHLDITLSLFRQSGATVSESAAWAYQALCLLLGGRVSSSLTAVQRAREQAEVHHYERDIVRAEWILGLAYTRLASQEAGPAQELLEKAELHLSDALHRCRQIDMVDYEADLLLAWAKLYYAKGQKLQAKDHAIEALAIANRSDFRVLRADIYNLLAKLELEKGNRETVVVYARSAYQDAICDGPPYCYKVALEETAQLLRAANHDPI